MSDLRLYLRYLGVSVRGQMQYRASFLMQSIAQFLTIGAEFLGMWALFHRFGHLRGWRLEEVALLYGLANLGFSLADAFGTGFDMFSQLVKSGDFDRLLLRPRSTALQVAGQELAVRRVGRLSLGAVVLAWAVWKLGVFSLPHLLLGLAAVIGTACLFLGLFVLQATLTFWTVETLEVWNAITYGGVETAQYPLAIYRPWFRAFFTLVVPLACVLYWPAHPLMGREERLGVPILAQWLGPLVGVAFLAACLQVWKLGERHYHSTGS